MRKKSDFILKLSLIIGDALALMLSFAVAYYIRVRIDPRPYTFETQLQDYMTTVVWLVPVMIVIIATLGLYKKSIVINQSRLPERGRLVLAAVLAVASLIVYDFFRGENLFPVRVMAVTAMVLSFVFLLIERIVVRMVIKLIFRNDYGVRRAIVIGNSKNTEYLANYIASTPESGYRLAGIASPDFLQL